MSLVNINLSEKEKELIIESWEVIMKDPGKFSTTFYDYLFQIDNSARHLFRDSMVLQKIKFVDSVNYLVKRMDNPLEASDKIRKLGIKHKSYNVKAKHYKPFGEAMIYAFEMHLGKLFDGECRESWEKLYKMISEYMIRGALKK